MVRGVGSEQSNGHFTDILLISLFVALSFMTSAKSTENMEFKVRGKPNKPFYSSLSISSSELGATEFSRLRFSSFELVVST